MLFLPLCFPDTGALDSSVLLVPVATFYSQGFEKAVSWIYAHVSGVVTHRVCLLIWSAWVLPKFSKWFSGMSSTDQSNVSSRIPFGYLVKCEREVLTRFGARFSTTIVGNPHLNSFNRLDNIWGSFKPETTFNNFLWELNFLKKMKTFKSNE